MAVPAFSFTARASPVAEIGRPTPDDASDVTWVDIGCDVHEITTDTGRGSISDRYAPGTATITASNVSGWADGTVPIQWSYFRDDFERSGPALGGNWLPWSAMQDETGADMLQIDTGAAVVVKHPAPTTTATFVGGVEIVDTFSAQGGAASSATIGPFTGVAVGDWVMLALQLDIETALPPPSLPGWTWNSDHGAGLSGSGWRHDVYTHRVTAEEAESGAPWTATWSPYSSPYIWSAVVARGVDAASQVRFYRGTTTHWATDPAGYYETNHTTGTVTDWPTTAPSDGCAIVAFAAGNLFHNVTDMTDVAEMVHASGGTATHLVELHTDIGFGDTIVYVDRLMWTSPASSTFGEWSIAHSWLLTPGLAPNPDSIPYEGKSCAIWAAGYDGDQFVDTWMGGMAAPDQVWPDASTHLELCLRCNEDDVGGSVAVFDWTPAWDDPDVTGTLDWNLNRRLDDGTWQGAPFASGTLTVDETGLPVPARFRFEADDAGPVRAYYQGALLGSGTDPAPPTGDRIGLYAEYFAGALSYGRTIQPGPPRFESVTAGSNIPVPILLEPGVRIRIGVHHQVHGYRWFFHGWVDAIVPTYDPSQRPVSRIECIDALGEIGRLPLEDPPEPTGAVEAGVRVTRLVRDEANWPEELAEIGDDATWLDNHSTSPDRAVELLTQTAASCGGAVYGDPQTGMLVFRGRDWQAWDPDLPPDGYITNGATPDAVLKACPSTWERSWRREDMTTQAALRSGTGAEYVYTNSDAEIRFGREPYAASLLAIEPRIMNILGRRQLKLRGPGVFPRVAAVLLDAATGSDAVDVMTVSTFTGPSRYQCGLVRDGIVVFDRQYLVTGIRHSIARDRWQCRLELDAADVFATKGARWGRGHWSRTGDVWGHSI